MTRLAAVKVGAFASEQKTMPYGMVGSLERNMPLFLFLNVLKTGQIQEITVKSELTVC